ncbi:MAG TPA: ankyrin repeat domain-containing protein [Chitinophagaceae bacterium]|nr:ankyrin repeat domain-containing protein [Chitinophagaceae bacterium]
MDYLQKLIEDIEEHSVEGIRECFANGVNPNDLFRNEPLIYELTSEYTRTPRFKDCVKAFADYGFVFEDTILLSVLLNDASSLETQLSNDPEAVRRKYTLRCAYTPLYEAVLLHICAEFNHVACAEVLVQYGADINAKAGADEYGFGGQTPIFHTVNQNSNQSIDMLNYLLSQSADLQITVPGLIWGKGYAWEILIPAVTPTSYAMMGLLPQMHRNEITISKVVSILLKAAYNIDYVPQNVPCAYLKK